MGKMKNLHIDCNQADGCKLADPQCPFKDKKKQPLKVVLTNRYQEFLSTVVDDLVETMIHTLDDDLPDVLDDYIANKAETAANIAIQEHFREIKDDDSIF